MSRLDWRYKGSHHFAVLTVGLIALLVGLGRVVGAASWWEAFVALGALYVSYRIYNYLSLCNSCGFHRLYAHRAYATTWGWQMWFLLTGTLSCYGDSIQWKLYHQRHHKHADTALDPDRGLTSLYSIFTTNYIDAPYSYSELREVADLSRDPAHRFAHDYYWAINGAVAFTLWLISGDCLLYLYLIPVGLVVLMGKVFNIYAHRDGAARDFTSYAFWSVGEWKHGLHHTMPWRWDLRTDDPGYHGRDAGAELIARIKL